MDVIKLFKTFLGMVKLDNQAYSEMDNVSMKDVSLVFLIISILGLIIGFFLSPSFSFVITMTIVLFLSLYVEVFIVTGILQLLSLLFGAKGSFSGFYKGNSIMTLSLIFAFIPFVSLLVPIWNAVMTVFLIKNHHKLSTGKSVMITLLPLIAFLLLIFLLMGSLFALKASFTGLI